MNPALKKKIQEAVQPYLLQGNVIINELPEAEKAALKKFATTETGKRGQVLFKQGSFPKGVYWIVEGKVKIFQETHSGQRQTLYVYTENDLVGYRQFIADVTHPVTARFLEDTSYLHIPGHVFRNLIKDSPLFSRSLLTMLSREFTVWMNRMTVFTQYSVRHRLILALLTLHEQYTSKQNDQTVIKMTRTDLAEYVGASLETVVRALNGLKKEGLIELKGRNMQLHKIEVLMDILQKESR